MIIFYKKSTREIIGTIEGRVHDENTLEKGFIQPSNVDRSDIDKYVVPFKENWVEKEIEGKKQKTVDGLTPDTNFNDLILDFESGKKSIYAYKVKINQDGEVVDFEKVV